MKKHILFVSRAIPKHQTGGMEIAAWDLAKEFVKLGCRVSFITTSIPNAPERIHLDGIDVTAIANTKSGTYSKNWWRESKKYFDNEYAYRVDGIFSVSAGAYGIVSSKKLPKNLPIIFQAHGTSLREFKSKLTSFNIKNLISSLKNIYGLLVDFKYYKKFSKIVAVGKGVFDDLQAYPFAYLNNKVLLIYNGIDTNLFSVAKNLSVYDELNISPVSKLILTVSRLHPQKGVHVALNAFAKYLHESPNTHYVIVGDGKARTDLMRQAQQLNIDKNVHFIGHVNRENLQKYYSAANVFLFTTLHQEGLPLNVLEALASGLPVVLSKHVAGSLPFSKNIFAVDEGNIVSELEKALAVDGKVCYLPEEFTLEYSAKKYLELF